MAGETLPRTLNNESSFGNISLEEKGQIYPDAPTGGGGSTRPVAGQAWPRGNLRGNG